MTPSGFDHTLERQFTPRPVRAVPPRYENRVASGLLAAKRARVRKIRTRVIAPAVALFLALWGVIFSELVTSHASTVASTKATATPVASKIGTAHANTTSAVSSGTASSSTGSSGTSSASTGSSNAGTTSAVSTSQS